ncbi:MAG: T9SS C-terminal target domain-containing protein [Bacteroidetes bacterium]|nr:MAG: T9SS C-terminal target domain-containing protein [Bacteroidota bacterium]
MTVNFTAMSAPAANDEFVTYQLFDRPLNNVSANNTASNYWLVRQFGTQTFNYNQMNFTLPASDVISTTAPASDMKLFKRDHNSGGTWGTEIGTGTSANNTTKIIAYTLSPVQTSFSEFSVASVTSPLPITLTGLKGGRVEGLNGEKTEEVKLEWTTASEINNKGFEIQVSENAQTYKTIAFVDGAGNSNAPKNYQLTTINQNDGYYRLKQLDFDGTFSYSPVVFVEGMAGKVVVYPNPNNGTFTISTQSPLTPEGGITQAKLFNAQGIEVPFKISPSGQGALEVSISPSGQGALYFLHTVVAGKVKVTKIVVER